MSPPAVAFHIRPYASGDAPAMSRLFYESVRVLGPRGYGPNQVAAWAPAPADPHLVHACATDGRTTLVAVNDACHVLAYGDLEADGHVDHLYCHPDVAGTGVAAAVLEALMSQAVEAGMSRMHAEASELARPLFARKGFVMLHRRDFQVRGVAIHNYAMVLTLG